MMQRGSAGTMRMVILVSGLSFLLLGALYVLKRGEVTRLRNEMKELSEKQITLHSQVEAMTKEVGGLQARLVKAEDEKATVIVEREQLMKDQGEAKLMMQRANDDKSKAQREAEDSLKGMQDELQAVRSNQDQVEGDLEECEDEGLKCENGLTSLQTQLASCKSANVQCEQRVAAASQQALPAQRYIPNQAQGYVPQPALPDSLKNVNLQELQARFQQPSNNIPNSNQGGAVAVDTVPEKRDDSDLFEDEEQEDMKDLAEPLEDDGGLNNDAVNEEEFGGFLDEEDDDERSL